MTVATEQLPKTLRVRVQSLIRYFFFFISMEGEIETLKCTLCSGNCDKRPLDISHQKPPHKGPTAQEASMMVSFTSTLGWSSRD